MKTLILSILVGLLALNPAFAEQNDDIFVESHFIIDDFLTYASNFIGKDVFIANSNDLPAVVTHLPVDWESVGRVDDLVLQHDGQIHAVLMDVGGFLGIGARTLAVKMKAVRVVKMTNIKDFYLVIASTHEQIENAPEYIHHETMGQPYGRTLYPVQPPYGRMRIHPFEGYERVESSTVSVDDLKSAAVYDENHQGVASVSNVLVTPDGKVDRVIIDVGGFLGIGSRSVAFQLDELDLHQSPVDLRIYLPMTEEELRNKPEYSE
jgi:hypothetical protein